MLGGLEHDFNKFTKRHIKLCRPGTFYSNDLTPAQELLVWVDEVLLQVLRHPETLLPLVPKYSLHSLVGSEELLVLRILGIGSGIHGTRISSRRNKVPASSSP